MKRILIISPHFAPSNAADMQRVRISLPYFKSLGWEAEVVAVDEKFNDIVKDELLLESIPPLIIIHKVNAFSKKITSKFGLGSLALRSMWFYRKKVNQLLATKQFDLIYFSTTEFPICILGAYWRRKFKIRYVIDMQDPWHTDFYKDKPKAQQPKKYWFSYRLHKKLEPIAMKKVDGLISVSKSYLDVLTQRYPRLQNIPKKVVTFGAFELDFKIAAEHEAQLDLVYSKLANQINLVYIGRGGYDMQPAVDLLLQCFKKGLKDEPEMFHNIHLHFIGTSYAPKGKGTATLSPIAQKLELANYVTEHTDRIGYYESLKNLAHADGLIIIGSNDEAYNASKLYPYILANKPLLAIFHGKSNAAMIVKECNAGNLITLDSQTSSSYPIFKDYVLQINNNAKPLTNWEAFEKYTAQALTQLQVEIFDRVMALDHI